LLSSKLIGPNILANSLPFLFIKIVVGRPIKEKLFAKLLVLSKKISKLFIFNSLKKNFNFEISSLPTFIGNIT